MIEVQTSTTRPTSDIYRTAITISLYSLKEQEADNDSLTSKICCGLIQVTTTAPTSVTSSWYGRFLSIWRRSTAIQLPTSLHSITQTGSNPGRQHKTSLNITGRPSTRQRYYWTVNNTCGITVADVWSVLLAVAFFMYHCSDLRWSESLLSARYMYIRQKCILVSAGHQPRHQKMPLVIRHEPHHRCLALLDSVTKAYSMGLLSVVPPSVHPCRNYHWI